MIIANDDLELRYHEDIIIISAVNFGMMIVTSGILGVLLKINPNTRKLKVSTLVLSVLCTVISLIYILPCHIFFIM